ncbi:hypothetical protein EI53_01256 [Fusobacterium naviforme]|nr:hypothetical protein F7P78_06275 [Fusobacterium naviforme]PSL10194.1 hypothetical protein EI53_01256 [Fusobacterium naviforme]STO27604.1 Uncharacterised protein [Fusobacterium naviforme]
MSSKDKENAVQQQEQPEGTAAPKFTVEKLAEHARELFGVSSCTYAGATHGITGEYTVEEMKQHIEAWKKKEVK